MFGSDWRNLAKIVGIGLAGLLLGSALILLSFGAGVSSGRYEGESNRHAAEYKADTEKRVTACSRETDPGRMAQCIQEAVAASHENQRDEQDLKAQRDMAKWASWLLIVTFLQIPIGIAGFVALLLTIDQGRRALSHAEKVAVAQLRHYVQTGRTTIKKSKNYADMWVVCVRIVNRGVRPSGIVLSNVKLRYCPLPIPEVPPEFDEEPGDFEGIANRPAKIFKPIFIEPNQLEAIKALQAGILVRTWIKYRPSEDADWEETEELVVYMGSDMEEGTPRLIPGWAYKAPKPNEEGQEHLNLPPPEPPEASAPPAD